MMNKQMMIDYRKANGEGFERKQIDDMEFCIRNGNIYFVSDGVRYNIPIEQCSQVYIV